MSSPRRAALNALLEITERGAYANLCLKDVLKGLSERDARWVSATVYTTLDNLIYIDFILAHFTKGRVQPQIRGILRLGLTQALFMDVPERAACNESVELCKEIGKAQLTGYVNGVLRAVLRSRDNLPPLPDEPVDRLSIKYSWPKWLVEDYIGQYGSEFTERLICAKFSGMTYRAQRPYTTAELESALKEKGMAFTPGSLERNALRLEKGLDVERDPLFVEGKATVQSESAMIVCRLLGAEPGQRILDACAAPGGKTAYLSHLMEGSGHIDAWDIHSHRVMLMERTFERLHVGNANSIERDAAIFDPSLTGAYDAVLIDAPCSGLGVWGKPDVRYSKSDAAIDGLVGLQSSILEACANYVRVGGTLVYATCTISHRENEEQVRRFLENHPEFQPGNMSALPPALHGRAKDGMIQLFPHIDYTEGFFMARLEKRNG